MFHFLEPQRKQQLRRRLQKSHLKREFVLLQTLARLFHFVHLFDKFWRIFLEIDSKGLYQSSGKGTVVLCSRPTQNVKLGRFTS